MQGISKKNKLVYLAVFTISCSVLIFETILLKFFSFKMISSWASLIVSIAFLGIGASGTYLAMRKGSPSDKIDFPLLSNFSILYTILIPLSIMIFAWIPFSPPQELITKNIIFNFFYMLLFSLPFFLSGVCISYILSLKKFPVGRVLFFDLFGAGVGCLISVIFIRLLGAYGLLALSMVFALFAPVIFTFLSEGGVRLSLGKMKLLLPIPFLFALLLFPQEMVSRYGFDIVSTNREEHHFEIFKDDFGGIAATYWNPITRIDLSKEGQSDKYIFLFGLSEKFRNKKYPGRYILLDSGAATRQFKFSDTEKENEFFGHFLFSLPYHLKPSPENVLVIGPGGGLEVLIGKYFEAKNIDAVDINSDIIDILKGRNKGDPLAEVYSRFTLSNERTTVKYYSDEGRSYLSRKIRAPYDIVQLTGVDLLSALMSGGLVLSESYLYTQEAMGYYYDALKENGYFQISYWGGPYSLRLFITALEMLESKGVECSRCGVAVVADKQNFTNLIIKKGSFSSAEVLSIKEISQNDGYEILYVPSLEGLGEALSSVSDSRYYFLASEKKTRESLIKGFSYNIRPTHDDKPFFYAIHPIEQRRPLERIIFDLFPGKNNPVVSNLTSVGIFLSFVFILLPLIIRRLSSKQFTEKVPIKLLFFSGLVGLAFSLLEVVLIQKFAIFVGGPFYSMTVTLPTVLIFYSLGAFCTAKSKLPARKMFILSIIGIALYGLVAYLFLDRLISNFFYLDRLGRIFLTMIFVLPVSFLIGFPTPLFLEAVKNKIGKSAIPWLWGVNSCANVIGALTFTPLAQNIGFNLLLLISCGLYLVSSFFLLPERKLLK